MKYYSFNIYIYIWQRSINSDTETAQYARRGNLGEHSGGNQPSMASIASIATKKHRKRYSWTNMLKFIAPAGDPKENT